jgi:hypothetical protein
MQQARKTMPHSSIVNRINHERARRARDLALKSWDQELYGHDRSVLEDEDQISRVLMLKDSLAVDVERNAQELYVAGQLIAGGAPRPALPLDYAEAGDLPIPRRPAWTPGLTDKASLLQAEQARPAPARPALPPRARRRGTDPIRREGRVREGLTDV